MVGREVVGGDLGGVGREETIIKILEVGYMHTSVIVFKQQARVASFTMHTLHPPHSQSTKTPHCSCFSLLLLKNSGEHRNQNGTSHTSY